MGIKKYSYSLGQIVYALLLCGIFVVFLLFFIIKNSSDYEAWIVFGAFALVIGLLLRYFYKKNLLPYLRKETALEFDEDKLQSFIEKKIVYWKDVNYYEALGGNQGMTIYFSMKDDAKDIAISTKYVNGDDNEIRDTIEAYFQKYKVDWFKS